MKDGFLRLWGEIGARGAPEHAFSQLQALYLEPHRSYHNLGHIGQCLREFREVRELAESPGAVEFAIWYHDAIYDPKASDNEARSAQLAHDTCLGANLPDVFALEVCDLIRVTKHEAVPGSADGKLMVDVDLSILGRPAGQFGEYENAIRREYSWVSEDVFREKRRELLAGFLGRRTIYATAYFQEKYEVQARENLRRSIAALS